jgi:hypothetical protein
MMKITKKIQDIVNNHSKSDQKKILITAIDHDGDKWYVRILTGDTKCFPRGIALASSYSSKESALAFQQEVNKYLGATSLDGYWSDQWCGYISF